ncbi:MAG: hypothetical protein ACI936_000094 [Paraglaciecola sp.]|jgi:hypothetical protein
MYILTLAGPKKLGLTARIEKTKKSLSESHLNERAVNDKK